MSRVIAFPSDLVRDLDLRQCYAYAKEIGVPANLLQEWKDELRRSTKSCIEFVCFLETYAEATK